MFNKTWLSNVSYEKSRVWLMMRFRIVYVIKLLDLRITKIDTFQRFEVRVYQNLPLKTDVIYYKQMCIKVETFLLNV